MSDEAVHASTLERLEAVDTRLRDLEQRISALTQIVGVVVDTLSRVHAETVGQLAPTGAAADSQQGKITISPGIARVVRLVNEGQNEQAQQELQAMPAEELAEQPAAVALVAAALCIQRGDLHSGQKALERARELTDDPRLLRVLELVEQQGQI